MLIWQRSFQMTVESNYDGYDKRSVENFRTNISTNEKQNQNHLVRVIFPRFERVTGSC